MSKIYFISRHELTPAQRATLVACGYAEHERKEVVFKDSPSAELRLAGVTGDAVAVVAPLWVGADLLNSGLEVIEFRNRPSSRAKGVFICEGATVMRFANEPDVFGRTRLSSYFVPSPIPVGDQEEVTTFSVIS